MDKEIDTILVYSSENYDSWEAIKLEMGPKPRIIGHLFIVNDYH